MDVSRSRDRAAGAATAHSSTPPTPERGSLSGPTPRSNPDNSAQPRPSESTADGSHSPTNLKPQANNHRYGNSSSSTSNVWKHFGPDDSDDSPSDDTPGRSSRYSGKPTNKFQSFIRKLGRSAQKGEYLLPSNIQERRRMNLVHQLCLTVHNQMLYLAPLVAPRRVLDIGTGTGVWAIDFANQHPKSEVIGIDINPIDPEPPVPPNCSFGTADVFEEWTFAGNKPFDYIHVRSLGVVINHEQLFKSIHDHLAPRGFAEFQEWDLKLECADHSLEGVRKLGKDPAKITKYKDLLPAAGFEQVVGRKYAVPVNPWAPGKSSRAMGEMNKANLLASILPLSIAILPRGLGNSSRATSSTDTVDECWSNNDVEDLLAGVRKDLDNTNIHAFMTLMTVYCQKPRDESSATATATKSSGVMREKLHPDIYPMSFE